MAECARWGLRFLLESKLVDPVRLCALYRGYDNYRTDGDIGDRTFCALRVWAVVRPDEMREWIQTQRGEALQSALTWLLEHPWGGPDKEEPAKR